jgi:hypothetical protein
MGITDIRDRMKLVLKSLVVLMMLWVSTLPVEAVELEYDVEYEGKIVGKQTMAIDKTAGRAARITLSAQSKMEAVGFLLTYRFEDRLIAVLEGAVIVEYDYFANDNGKRTEITARTQDGRLVVMKKDNGKPKTATIAKDQYTLTSWSLFCDPTLSFLPADASPARRAVLMIEDGAVAEQIITKKAQETVSVAGKSFASTPVTWKKGQYVSQSWHAAILNNLPVKYLLVDESGKTTLWLKKW